MFEETVRNVEVCCSGNSSSHVQLMPLVREILLEPIQYSSICVVLACPPMSLMSDETLDYTANAYGQEIPCPAETLPPTTAILTPSPLIAFASIRRILVPLPS